MVPVQQAIDHLQQQMTELFETNEFFQGKESIFGHRVNDSLLSVSRIENGVLISVSSLNEDTNMHEFCISFQAYRPTEGREETKIVTTDINMSQMRCSTEKDLLSRMAMQYTVASQVIQFFTTGKY